MPFFPSGPCMHPLYMQLCDEPLMDKAYRVAMSVTHTKQYAVTRAYLRVVRKQLRMGSNIRTIDSFINGLHKMDMAERFTVSDLERAAATLMGKAPIL